MNGDGTIDISDAVYLLSNLFTGGPAMKPIECPAPAKGRLPATGQTKCYEATLAEVACDSGTCPGQDGFYSTGCLSEGRFTDNGDGTATDHCTGLMWQKDTADVNGDGTGDGSDFLAWCEALAYCEDMDFAGHDNWRLPNVRELESIVDYGRVGPSIDPKFGAKRYRYWSSTPHLGEFPGSAWYVGFFVGDVNFAGGIGDSLNVLVRAVRNSQ